eukprot:7069522-Pyramimonas_sp.AAC.1
MAGGWRQMDPPHSRPCPRGRAGAPHDCDLQLARANGPQLFDAAGAAAPRAGQARGLGVAQALAPPASIDLAGWASGHREL